MQNDLKYFESDTAFLLTIISLIQYPIIAYYYFFQSMSLEYSIIWFKNATLFFYFALFLNEKYKNGILSNKIDNYEQ
jgi:hypothetical protein